MPGDPSAGHGVDVAEPMSHEEALEMNAVELYALKELEPETNLRFEAHFFECAECARAVGIEQSLAFAATGMKRVRQWKWPQLSFWAWAPGTAALAGLILFQNVYSIPRLNKQIAMLAGPEANTVVVARQKLLGDEFSHSIHTASITVEMTLPAGVSFPFYRVDLLERQNTLSQVLPAPEDGSRLSLHLAASTVSNGVYDVLVSGLSRENEVNGHLISEYSMTIKKEKRYGD